MLSVEWPIEAIGTLITLCDCDSSCRITITFVSIIVKSPGYGLVGIAVEFHGIVTSSELCLACIRNTFKSSTDLLGLCSHFITILVVLWSSALIIRELFTRREICEVLACNTSSFLALDILTCSQRRIYICFEALIFLKDLCVAGIDIVSTIFISSSTCEFNNLKEKFASISLSWTLDKYIDIS